jgi:hypothetical protein
VNVWYEQTKEGRRASGRFRAIYLLALLLMSASVLLWAIGNLMTFLNISLQIESSHSMIEVCQLSSGSLCEIYDYMLV